MATSSFVLDLFDKRFAVYSAAKKFLRRGAAIEDDDLFEYREKTQDAVFLFDEQIADYLRTLHEKGVDLQTTGSLISDRLPVGEERTRLCEKRAAQIKELKGELHKLRDRFTPYLKFEVWK